MRIPTEADWEDYRSDLDQEWAHRQFAGRTNEEMRDRLYRNVIEATADLRWMPKIPFRYYMLGFRDYVMAREFQSGDGSDAAGCFVRLVLEKLEEQPEYIRPIMDELLPAVRYVAANQALYGANERIYGSFPEMLARIERLASHLHFAADPDRWRLFRERQAD